MDFTGRYHVPASPETTWMALNDPQILKQCIPGCDRVERIDPAHYQAVATLKIGPVKATFKTNITLSELDPPKRCILRGEGQGGVAGFARGEAEIVLEPDAGGTWLSYNAKAAVGGKLAQIAQRLIDGAAKQMADDFFGHFVEAVAAMASAETAAQSAPAVPATAGESMPQSRREGLAPEMWVVGLIAVIVILLLLFGIVVKP